MVSRYTTIVFLFCFILGPVYSQNIPHESVAQGIELFYAADFEEAMRILQNAIINEPLGDEEQFYSHLYVGFCHIRQESDFGKVRLYFKQAISILPNMELDPFKIPPDLYDAFVLVKASVLGTIFVHSDPLDAEIMLIEPATSKVDRKLTPAVFRNLLQGSYQVLVAKSGYDTFSAQVEATPGGTDTLRVVLLKKEKAFLSKYWAYGASALVATAAIFAITTGGGDETTPTDPPINPPAILPNPPARP